MDLKNLIVEKNGHVRLVTINRPPTNAWTLEAFLEFETVLDELERDKEARVVVITGAGEKCFSSGFDINDYANVDKSTPKGQELFRRVDRFTKPTIAAINGYALGGGCDSHAHSHRRLGLEPRIRTSHRGYAPGRQFMPVTHRHDPTLTL